MHNLNIKIEVNLLGLSDEEYLKIQSIFAKKIIGDYVENISFNDLDKLFMLSKRNYLTKNIEYPKMDYNEFEIKETTIEIIG